MKNLSVEVLTGKQIIPVIPEVAKLRIKMFLKFPYLYDGGIKYKDYSDGSVKEIPNPMRFWVKKL